jgi:hypothetical protein
LKIQLLHVPGCANVEMARRVLQSSLSELGFDARVEEHEGAYPSPTILVDGRDVMGEAEADGASCRLDVPTRERVVAALESASRQRT